MSTAVCERSFSLLRRLKIWVRHSTGQDRLYGLELINAHPELVPPADEIVDEFMRAGQRRIVIG